MELIPRESFIQVVKNTPLIAIDLVVENEQNEILLGWRRNQPAKGYWFVPGGRILKNEKYTDAFKRITKNELGNEITLPDALFLGIYEHIYPDENFANEPGFGTHYIVNAYRISLSNENLILPTEQHADYRWASIDELLEDANVHENTKNYFNGFEL